MKIFTLLAVILLVTTSHAQDVKGYYITSSGQKTEVYFKQADFNDTASLQFRTSKKGEYSALAENITAYGFDDEKIKFEKHTVNIDISNAESISKNPEFQKQAVYLNVIIEGDASLYSYTKDYGTKYFFSTKDTKGISELVNKKYKLENGSTTENPMYRQQLYNAVKCDGDNVSDFANVLYDKKQLVTIFKNFNECTDSKYVVFGSKRKSGFKYTVSAGVYNTMLRIPDGIPAMHKTGRDVNFGIGIESAFVFTSETIEFFFRGEFETINVSLEETQDLGYGGTTSIYEVSGTAATLYVGPRYNLPINDNNKVFFDAALGFTVPFGDITKSTILIPVAAEPYPGQGYKFDLDPIFTLNFGVGYTLNNKIGLALRYETNRDFLDNANSPFKMKLSRLGLNLRYTFN